MAKVTKLSKFQKAAKVEPFVLDLENGTTIEFHRPNLRKVEELATAQSPKRILEILCGDQFEAAYEVLGELDVEEFEQLLEEVLGALGMGGEGNPTKR